MIISINLVAMHIQYVTTRHNPIPEQTAKADPWFPLCLSGVWGFFLEFASALGHIIIDTGLHTMIPFFSFNLNDTKVIFHCYMNETVYRESMVCPWSQAVFASL